MNDFKGYCQHCDTEHVLPGSHEAYETACALIPIVRPIVGKGKGRMVGVLVCEDSRGRKVYLKAYSGTTILPGLEVGWAPPTRPTHVTEKEEAETFSALNKLTQAIEKSPVDQLEKDWAQSRQELEELSHVMQAERKAQKSERQALREANPGDKELAERLKNESYDQSVAYRKKRAGAREVVAKKRQTLDQAIAERLILKRKRKQLSVQLQASFMATHSLENFRGEKKLLEDISLGDQGIRQGSGECAAPKLLIDAARRGLSPLSISEIWVGTTQTDPPRREGHSYGPCLERCIPIMGYLLCGMENPKTEGPVDPKILAEGTGWVACNKPGGLLSVPGRGSSKVDSMLTRVRTFYGAGSESEAAHRLDLETSGVQLFALDPMSNSALQTQFAHRTTTKIYLAWIQAGPVNDEGEIDAPIRQKGRYVRGHETHDDGKPSQTRYKVIERQKTGTLVMLFPRTGRTHQLRVHCSSSNGLSAPIIGDSLYGSGMQGDPLLLHAWRLTFKDPVTHSQVCITAPVPESWPDLELRGGYEELAEE